MDWSNEVVLEFIELLEGEPCIWNSKSKFYKNRTFINDAWTRIRSKMTVPCTIEELRKKRNSLLTQYRDYLKKIKNSRKTGSEGMYRPSWFAFDAIHSYMGPIYDDRLTLSTETQENTDEIQLLPEDILEESIIEGPLSRESNSESESDSVPAPKRQRGAQDLMIEKKLMDEAYVLIKNRCNRKENKKEPNECDLYGQLLALKLKTLDDDDRLILMNEIDNIVFKYVFDARKKNQLVY